MKNIYLIEMLVRAKHSLGLTREIVENTTSKERQLYNNIKERNSTRTYGESKNCQNIFSRFIMGLLL